MARNPCREFQLGDLIEQALSAIGLTQDRVERWLNRPCGCEERRNRLNQISGWASRIVQGKLYKAEEYLNSLIDD